MTNTRTRSRGLALGLALVTLGCGPASTTPDASSDAACRLGVEVGYGGNSFVPYVSGDQAEIVLGFQGFQMLPLDVRVSGVSGAPETISISATVTITDTSVEGGRTDRAVPVAIQGTTLATDGWLLFFNSAPVSQIAGHDGLLELIVHSGTCVGGARVTLRLVDLDHCVSFDASVPDVGALDAGVPDGAIACGATP